MRFRDHEMASSVPAGVGQLNFPLTLLLRQQDTKIYTLKKGSK